MDARTVFSEAALQAVGGWQPGARWAATPAPSWQKRWVRLRAMPVTLQEMFLEARVLEDLPCDLRRPPSGVAAASCQRRAIERASANWCQGEHDPSKAYQTRSSARRVYGKAVHVSNVSDASTAACTVPPESIACRELSRGSACCTQRTRSTNATCTRHPVNGCVTKHKQTKVRSR